MKKFIKYVLLLIILITTILYSVNYYNNLNLNLFSKEVQFASLTFICGFTLALLISDLLLQKIEKSLNVYKRELEKESIDSNEHSSKIKVLESKIIVLEKALKEALNK
jgi:predicted metal-binding transcription factor (methanogenesis marker protein 9)